VEDERNPVTTHTAQVDDLRLVALSSAVNCTSLFVRFTLSEWSLLPLLDDATRAACDRVSAIVDNSNPKAPGFITIRLRLQGEYLVVEVQDDLARALPAGSVPGANNGVYPLAGRGNLAWYELPLPVGMTAQGVSLPRRDNRRSVITEEMTGERAEADPAVLQRVLSSLSQWSDR
jgi:hypothetical protein